jgi:ADP-ribosylglycohydrolase
MGLNSGKRDKDHFRGCLLGGAVGDALGWPVEFLKLNHGAVALKRNSAQPLFN